MLSKVFVAAAGLIVALYNFGIPCATAQSILPPAPDAKGGGNPLQGLGRKDDPSPPRYDDFLPKTTQSQSDSDTSGTDALEKTLDANGLKLQDVPTMINKMQQESARVAGEAGIETGGSSLDVQPLAAPLTPPPAASSTDFPDQEASPVDSNAGADSRMAGSAGAQGSSKPPGSLNAAGEYENGPAGLPPGPGLGEIADGNRNLQPERTVSENMRLRSPRSQEVTDRIRAALTPKAPKRNETLVPHNGLVPAPPPVMPFSQHQSRDSNTPERQALQMIHQGKYAAAEDQLRNVVSSDPTNLHARYLLAVALVNMKNYDEARTLYSLIIQKSQDTRLIELATAGLEKLGANRK